jgi:hypothetical protein
MDFQTWQAALLDQLDLSGPDAAATAQFIRDRRIRVGFRKASPSVAALWYIDGNVYLNNARYSPESPVTDPYLLCLIVHEAQHLRQGIPTALSVYGELEAWQIHFRMLEHLLGTTPIESIAKILALPLSYDRDLLRQARALMQEYGGKGYRSDLLPLFPWGKEIAWWITRRAPR